MQLKETIVHKSILYITKSKNFVINEFNKRADIINLKIDRINDIKELPAKLLFAVPHYDVVVFDIPSLVDNSKISVFEIINMVMTFTKCNDDCTPVLAVLVELTTDLKLLSKALATDISGIVPFSEDFGADETENAVTELLCGHTYIPKHIIDRIKSVSSNTPAKKLKTNSDCIYLTARQEQVLRLICNRGASNKAIAKLLNISESTVKLHITSVLKKYGVRNRTQLALFAGSEYRV
jgi:DNA-binding NarL/FixJ family response regulator